jgi:microcystin degradation protein MlrC
LANILICECKQEVSSFNPVKSRYEDFLVDRGEAMIAYHRGVRTEVGGALEVLRNAVGGYSARGITSAGTLREECFQKLAAEFLEPVRAGFDGVYLALHGALAAEETWDTEGYLVEETRKRIGAATPLVVSLDLHGILTDRILEHADAAVVYHTNPHIDFFETGQRAARLLLRLVAGGVKPVTVRVRIPALVRGAECITRTGIFGRLVAKTIAFENSGHGLSGGIFIGNPFTDVEDLASNVLLVGDGEAAEELGVGIAHEFWDARAEIQQPLTSLAESVQLAAATPGRIVLVDAADATSSGASGDSNAILAELLRQGVTRSALLPLVDAPAVAACREAGVGAALRLELGGSLDSRFAPVRVSGVVEKLFSGTMRSESHGEVWEAGDGAVLRVGAIAVVLSSRAVSLYDRTLFQTAGLDVRDFDMCVVKSPLCQPRFFEDGAARVIHVDAPGSTSANVAGLGHRAARRPLYPLDPDMDYRAAVKVFRR